MRSNLRCGLFTCALTLVGALLLRTTLLSHNYAEQQYHALRGHASRQAALRDARGAAAALVDAAGRGNCKRGGKCHRSRGSYLGECLNLCR